MFMSLYGENGVLSGPAGSATLNLVQAYITALCETQGAGCLSSTGDVWLLFDAVYDGMAGFEYLDATLVVQALSAT